jgi:LPS-assembly protein
MLGKVLRRNKIILCALSSVLCTLAASIAIAAEFAPKEPIVVNGDRVEYYQEQKKVVGLGNVSITYKDVLLTCDRITVYLDTREGIAEGNVKVTQKDAFLTGDRMNYNFDTKKGTLLKGTYTSLPFYGKAREVDKVANKDQYNLERGYITTCDLDNPHYRAQARRVKIYLDDRIEAQHILMFVGNVPVMYFPYYSQPMEGGKNNFTITPGQSDEWGYYALTAYRYQLDGYNRGDVLLDYRSKRGLAEGVNHYYKTEGVGDGAFKFYNTKDYYKYLIYGQKKVQDHDTVYRYRYQWRHKWEIPDEGASFIVQFNRLSDPNIIKDFIYNEYEEEGAAPDTFVSVITSKQDYNTQLLIRKRFGKFQTIVERLPEYTISIPNFNIADTPLYYTASASGVYLNKTFDNLTNSPLEPQKDLNITRFDVYNKLSYMAKLFGALAVTPYGAVENTYFSRNAWGDTNQIRTIFSAGVQNQIKFYKIYDVKTDFLGLDINRLRHIITPTVDYYFVEQPTIDPSNLIQFDGIDAITKANGMNFGIENRLQTKRMEGGQMKSVDLATFYVNVPYVFRLKKDDPTAFINHTQYFTSVDLQLEVIPYSWLYSVSKMSVNTKNQAVRTLSIDLVGSQGDKWSLGGGYIYQKEETGMNNVATISGMYKIDDKWRARCYERFAIPKSFQEQQYTIIRDLHCWSVELTYDYTKGDRHDFYVMFRLKAFPQHPVGLRRTYSRPEFGRREEGTNIEAIS